MYARGKRASVARCEEEKVGEDVGEGGGSNIVRWPMPRPSAKPIDPFDVGGDGGRRRRRRSAQLEGRVP